MTEENREILTNLKFRLIEINWIGKIGKYYFDILLYVKTIVSPSNLYESTPSLSPRKSRSTFLSLVLSSESIGFSCFTMSYSI